MDDAGGQNLSRGNQREVKIDLSRGSVGSVVREIKRVGDDVGARNHMEFAYQEPSADNSSAIGSIDTDDS